MPRKKATIWEHPSLRHCKCIERYGNVYTVIFGRNPVAIKGLKFVESNRETALEVLQSRYFDYMKHQGEVVADAKSKLKVSEALAEYLEYKRSRVGHTRFRELKLELNKVIIFDMEISKLTKNYKDYIKIADTLNLKDSSFNTYLSVVGTFFKYLYNMEYIDKPINLTLFKKSIPPAAKNTFSDEDTKKIIDYFRSKNRDDVANLILLISTFGLRIAEALKLQYDVPEAVPIENDPLGRKSIFTKNKIIVDGKRVKYNVPKIREIPTEIFPNGKEIAEQILLCHRKSDVKLFPLSVADYGSRLRIAYKYKYLLLTNTYAIFPLK